MWKVIKKLVKSIVHGVWRGIYVIFRYWFLVGIGVVFFHWVVDYSFDTIWWGLGKLYLWLAGLIALFSFFDDDETVHHGLQVGDIIEFGNYPQGANGEVQPIEWRVLRLESDSALVISKYALDCMKYNETKCNIAWSQCTLRKWLNRQFIKQAFSKVERRHIRKNRLSNPNSKFDGTVLGCAATKDKIFCLSHDETLSLFEDDEQRQCHPTAYAKARNSWTNDKGFCIWWLRSPGDEIDYAANVRSDGGISGYGTRNLSRAVRPAFFISLSPKAWAIMRVKKEAGEETTAPGNRCRDWQVGDVIKFGDYPQGANGEVEPIEWQVLRRDNEGVLVISKYALDCQSYNEDWVGITWSQCTLRRWLNSDFINHAFSESERAQIKLMHLSNPNSKFDSDVPGGPATDDKIFCLSHDEALSLFANDRQRQCYPTAYAKSQNALTDDNGFCFWWLRSPGNSTYYAAFVNSVADICSNIVDSDGGAVRPAFSGCYTFYAAYVRGGGDVYDHVVHNVLSAVRPAFFIAFDQEAPATSRVEKAAVEETSSGNSRERWQVGDIIEFGNYPQGANGEDQPIEWQVLRRDNEGVLVISKYALDCQPYNEDMVDITWSQCTLRRWLNSEFINQAFSESERAQITQRHLSNPNSKFDSDVPGGPATDDKIFCLSHDEALNLFANDGQRQCYPTAYAKSQNAWTDDNGFCGWWLRSPGNVAFSAAYVISDGDLDSYVNCVSLAVRPALFIAF